VLYVHSQFLCSRLLAFDKTSAQPHFALANCSDAAMSVFYSPVSTRSLIFLQLWTGVVALIVFSSNILTWSADSLSV